MTVPPDRHQSVAGTPGAGAPGAGPAEPSQADQAGLRELSLNRRWAVWTAWGVLAAGVLLVIVFTIVKVPLDYSVYRWGGQAVTHDLRLYQERFDKEWFTYPPFAAVVFIPIAAIPGLVARLGWQLISLLALASACVTTLRLAGYRASKTALAAVMAAAIALEPMYHTLYLGQINLILLALILIDVSRAARGRAAGIGVGIAAAVKLTPLIFIALFLVSRRIKSAVIATATFAACGLIGYLVAPKASSLYWRHLFYDTKRVGAPYISNQSPYAMAIRIAGGVAQVGRWYLVIPLVLGAAGLIVAAILARHDDWLGAATTAGVTGLLVSPISWTHHWVWILPALVVLVQGGRRSKIAAAGGYLLFVVAPMWFTPRNGGRSEYGFHWLVTLVANCYLIAGLAFVAYMARRAYLIRGDSAGTAVTTDAAVPAAMTAVHDS